MSEQSPPVEMLRQTEAARLDLSRCCADPDTSLAETFRLACELSAKAMGVERVGIWLFDEHRTAICCADLYERSKKEHSEGAILYVADFPDYFSSVQIRKAIPAEFAVSDPRTAGLADAYLRPLGIGSMLDAGIFHDGELVGIVCHEHVGPPREWTTEERDFASSIADSITLKMKLAQFHEVQAAYRAQEARLVALQKADALAQMASGIAHDFNNLLTIVTSYSALLLARDELSDDAREEVSEISEASKRGTALVTGMLEFARPNGSHPIALDLSDATVSFLPVLRAAVGGEHQVRFDRPESVGQVLIDKTQFTRLLLNLVVNAREAMPHGGPIDLRIQPIRTPPGEGPTRHFVLLEVSDCGTGMDEATRSRIFEPFFTTKSTGTGLGMAIVRRVVDRAGGLIRIESTLGTGTQVQIFFPRVGGSSGGTSVFAIPPELRHEKSPS